MEKNKYKYRFKTEQEFINTFGENWKDVINGHWDGGSERRRVYESGFYYGRNYGRRGDFTYRTMPTGMNKFFGKRFMICRKDRILELEQGNKLRYHNSYWIHKDMLVCLFVPSYKPKRIIRKI